VDAETYATNHLNTSKTYAQTLHKASVAHPLQDLPVANLDGATLVPSRPHLLDFGFSANANAPAPYWFGAGAIYALI